MRNVRTSGGLLLLAFALPLFAQYQTPTVDGVVSGGEYAHSSGNWSLTWNGTYLYVALTNLTSASNAVIVYLDVDPRSTPTAGSNANGSFVGTTDGGVSVDSLPFRADARISGIQSSPDIKSRDDAGGWGSANSSSDDIIEATNGTTREIRVRWEALPGLNGVPTSFRWAGYEVGSSNISNPIPSANGTAISVAQTSLNYAYSIASTADGAATDPFSVQEVTVYQNGSSNLSSRVTILNNDTTSARRYLVFNFMSGTTITIPGDLPAITQTTTVDGTTNPAYSSTPVLVLQGFSTNVNNDHGLRFDGCTGCVVRGLVLQGHGYGIYINNGSNNSVVGNYIGTDVAGTGTASNSIGVGISGCTSCTVGGTTSDDRNLISGNTSGGITASSTSGLTIQGNYIGTKANGTESLTNPVGVNLVSANSTLVGGTSAGSGNVITTTIDASVNVENSNDVSIYGNLMGVGADGTTALGGGNGVVGINGSRLTIGATAASSQNKISHFAAGIILGSVTSPSIRGNSMEDNDFAIDIDGTQQAAPAVSAAQVLTGNLYVTFSLSASGGTGSLQLDLYDADTTSGAAAEGKTYRASSPCYSGSSLTNQQWNAGSTFTAGDKIVLIANSYSDGSCTTVGDGSSIFTPVITTTAMPAAVFTGPGSFSDTTKWSGGALPLAGQDFTILNSCTFDSASPARAYGDMTIGNGTTSGNLVWQSGNAVVLDVDDITIGAGNTGTAINMADAGRLRVRGNMTVGSTDFNGGSGTVEFTGTGKSVSSANAIFHNVTITGSLSIGGTDFYFNGALDVQTGATFSGTTGTFLRPQNGASITGSGTKSFATVAVGAGATVTASGNFSVTTAFGVDGTFEPTSSTVITGTGLTFTPTGTIRVTRTGANALTLQYVFGTIDATNCTTEYTGATNQNIAARTYKNLTINNPVSVQLTGNVTVSNLLTLTAGLVMGAGNEIFVTNSATGAVVQGTGWTRLNIHRAIATGTNTYLFPLGTGSASQPVSVTCNNVTVAAQIRMQGITQNAGQLGGNSGIDTSHDVGNTWTMQVESGTIASYDLTINFGTGYDAGSDPLRFVARRQHADSEVWSTTTFTAAATSISITGETMTDTHFYAAGQQSIDHYVVSASSPQSTGVAFNTTVTAQDVFNVTANLSSTVVTMTSSTGNAQFDSDGNGTFGDNTNTITNGAFTISTKDNINESVTITATDTNSKTGTSSSITVDAKTFTGPGSFSDTTKWSGGTLPNTGANFRIVDACTFDNAAPVRTYGTMILGTGATAGALSWQTGNTVVLDVNDVMDGTTAEASTVDMTNGGTLRVNGNMSLSNGQITGGTGTMELAGTGKTFNPSTSTLNNVAVTGTITLNTNFKWKGTLDVQTGASLTGATSTFVRPESGATITGSGTKSFYQFEVNSGTVNASGNFSVSNAFLVPSSGTFIPTASTVITGTGLTFTPSGTIKVTRNGSNALTTQFVFSTIDTTNCTTEYAGTANQFIAGGRTFKNLTVNNPVSVQLSGNTTVSGVFNFAQGLVMGTGNEIFVTNSATGAVVQGAGWTRLNIHRAIATGTNTYLFPLGLGSASQPVNVTFNNVTVAAQVRMQAIAQNAGQLGGNSGIDTGHDVGNTWTLQVESGTITSYDLTINFGTQYDAGSDPLRFVARRQHADSEVWSTTTFTAAATSISITGETMTDTHFYAAGQQSIDHYVVSASSPQSAGTPFTTTVTGQDVFNVTANLSGTVVTMTSSTGNAQFDSDGNGLFGDNTKTLTDGAFTISTKDNTIESVTITATDTNAKTGTSSAITVNLGSVSAATTTISASPSSIDAGGSTSTITVQAKDAGGNNLTSSAGTVTLSTNLGSLGSVTDNNNGTYTATLTSSQATGTATITGTINALSITDAEAVTFTAPPFGAPPLFLATATSTSQVSLSWTPVSGATGYEVWRSSLNSAYALVGSPTGTTMNDTGLTASRTYLYKVRAVNGGGSSSFTSPEAATTIVFTDTTLAAGTTKIKAVHITELRAAVNLMREAAGLSAATFTDSSLIAGTTQCKAAHLTELRTALDAARSAAGMTALTYTDTTITANTTATKAAHLSELRNAVQ